LGVIISIDAIVIGITGISGSGKTTIADLLGDALIKFTNLQKKNVAVLHLDNFYRPLKDVFDIQGIDDSKPDAIDYVNWDDPRLIDYDRLISAINELKENGFTDVPVYEKLSGSYKEGEFVRVYGNKIIIVESFLLFSADKVRGEYKKGKKHGKKVLENPKQKALDLLELIDQKIYVESNSDVALDRRLSRDASIGRHPMYTIKMWKTQVMKAVRRYIYPLLNVEFFDQEYDNTLFDASKIDKFIQDNLNGYQLNPNYENKKRRENWINQWYQKNRAKEVLPIYDNYWAAQKNTNNS
jgi:uridine kinase